MVTLAFGSPIVDVRIWKVLFKKLAIGIGNSEFAIANPFTIANISKNNKI